MVMPTLWYENIPNVILEAMCYGKPVIGSDLGGVAEIIEHEKDGLLVPPGDAQGLAESIQRLINDESLIEKMGRAARAKMETEFSPERHYEKLIAVFENEIQKSAEC